MKEITNLVQLLKQISLRYPEKVALVFGAKRITYAQLENNCVKLASVLDSLGIAEHDKVALWLPNCPEFVYSFFATLKLRAIVVPINSMFKREEARFIIEDSKAAVLICSIDKAPDAESILPRAETLKCVISLPAEKNGSTVLDFYSLLDSAGIFDREILIDENDLAEIVYTSGTTGKPKGACLSHKNLVSNVKDCARSIKLKHSDCFICILPLFHSFASTVCMLLPIYAGAKIVLMRAVRPFKRVIRAIFKNRVTVFTAVPSVFAILSEVSLARWKIWLSIFINPIRACICGAAALPFEVWYNFEKKFKRRLLQGYGLTEASPVVSLNPLQGLKKPESVGLPFRSIQVKVVDKDSQELPIGEVGELLVKGPNVMQGYYNLPEESAKVLRDGWLYTGDLAKIDQDGFIYIMGRIKEMINVRGLNVYPKEIEDVLYGYPRIKEAAVIGVLHRHRGEAPVAFVVKEGKMSEREVINYLRQNLASYKVPLRVFFKDALPKNPAAKILKRELRAEVENLFK